LVFFNIEGGHVLIQVVAEDRLNAHQVGLIHGTLDHSEIVHLAISIQIQIGNLPFRLIELLLKVLQVFGLSEESHDDLQIQVVAEIRNGGFRSIAPAVIIAIYPPIFHGYFLGFFPAP
jgi:hypothetical protein